MNAPGRSGALTGMALRWGMGLILLSCLLPGAGARASTPAGTLLGRVTDASPPRGPVHGVTITVLDAQGRAVARGSTDASGFFRLEGVPEGSHHVVFVFGSAKVVRRSVLIDDSATTRLDVTIETAGAGETIEIEERLPEPPKVAPRPSRSYHARPLPYSDEAIQRDEWRRAWLILDVDERGRVTGVEILVPAGLGLDEIAVREVRRYRFEPARDAAGRPVPSRVAWVMEWPSFWYQLTIKSTGLPPCRGRGPLNLGSLHPVYRDCRVPRELPPGVVLPRPR